MDLRIGGNDAVGGADGENAAVLDDEQARVERIAGHGDDCGARKCHRSILGNADQRRKQEQQQHNSWFESQPTSGDRHVDRRIEAGAGLRNARSFGCRLLNP